MDYSKQIKSLKEAWPTLEGFVQALKKRGFTVEVDERASKAIGEAWATLEKPSSFEYPEASAIHYSYLKKVPTIMPKPVHGLVFVDSSLKENEKLAPFTNVIFVEHVEAALDFALSHVLTPEWFGKSEPVPPGVQAAESVVIGPYTEIGEAD